MLSSELISLFGHCSDALDVKFDEKKNTRIEQTNSPFRDNDLSVGKKTGDNDHCPL